MTTPKYSIGDKLRVTSTPPGTFAEFIVFYVTNVGDFVGYRDREGDWWPEHLVTRVVDEPKAPDADTVREAQLTMILRLAELVKAFLREDYRAACQLDEADLKRLLEARQLLSQIASMVPAFDEDVDSIPF